MTTALLAAAQINNPLLKLKFDKVVFYDFEENAGKGSVIVDKNGKALQKILKLDTLDKSAITKFNIWVGDKKSYGSGMAACFDPHCGLVYFLKGKPVAQISICLDCNRLQSSIDIPAQKRGKQGQGENAYYIASGLSKSFRHFINNMLKRYAFSHQIRPGSTFDN